LRSRTSVTEGEQAMRRHLAEELGIEARELRPALHLPIVRPTDAIPRPKTRAECMDGPRPCPWASCKHHLALEPSPTGTLVVLFPDRDADEIPETCSLDFADRGGATLNEVAKALGVTRERVRQMEERALRKLADHADTDAELALPAERGEGFVVLAPTRR
jgi:hypothetical protein